VSVSSTRPLHGLPETSRDPEAEREGGRKAQQDFLYDLVGQVDHRGSALAPLRRRILRPRKICLIITPAIDPILKAASRGPASARKMYCT
jgi:hypothetical protein